jgi:hypothetical protein
MFGTTSIFSPGRADESGRSPAICRCHADARAPFVLVLTRATNSSMAMTIVLRRSAYREILWGMHAVLDSVPEGRERTAAFARQVLTRFGVPTSELEALATRIGEKLPRDLNETPMADVLSIFEQAIPIEWHDDMTHVGAEAALEFERALLRILVETPEPRMPREMTATMLELAGIIDCRVDQASSALLGETIENILASELWRSRDEPARRRLADSIVDCVERIAKLDLSARLTSRATQILAIYDDDPDLREET